MWGASRDRLRDPVGLGCLTSLSSHNETDPYSHPQLNRQQRPLAKKSKMGEGQGVGVPEAPGLKKLQLENAGSRPSPPWKKVDKINPRLALCYLFLTRVLSAKNIQGDYRHHPWGSRGRLLLVLLQKVKVLSLSVLSDSATLDQSSSVPGDSPGKNTGVDSCSLLQGIFPTQGSNPGLPHCR